MNSMDSTVSWYVLACTRSASWPSTSCGMGCKYVSYFGGIQDGNEAAMRCHKQLHARQVNTRDRAAGNEKGI